MVQLRYREACGAVWYGIVQSEIELKSDLSDGLLPAQRSQA